MLYSRDNILCTHIIQGSALGTMVGLLTFGNKKYESLDSLMRATIGPLYDATQKMLPLIDKDTEAFNDYMVSFYFHSHTLYMND